MPRVTVMESSPVRTFLRCGLDRPFLRVFEGLLDVASLLPDYRLSELFAGFPRVDYEDPVPYPVACSAQAWAAGSLPWMLISGLGVIPDDLQGTLRIRFPTTSRGRCASGVRRRRVTSIGWPWGVWGVGDARGDLLFEPVA
ncbi:MAG: hypothetical protein WB761_11370 [Solirubrobacteraceae bacterium]